MNFKIDYVDATGNVANYYPDFIVKVSEREKYIVETKGLVDLDDPLKIKRLKQWCADVNAAQSEEKFDFVYVDQDQFDTLTSDKGPLRGQLQTFADLVRHFRAYK